MSAYRHAPVPRTRVIYRMPLRDRIGRNAVVTLFIALAATGPIALLVALLFDGWGGIALVGLGLMVSVTATVFLVITWMTRMPETADRTVQALTADNEADGRCRVMSDDGRWTLPVRVQELSVGQKIRVTYREIAPQDDEEPGREVLEVRAFED